MESKLKELENVLNEKDKKLQIRDKAVIGLRSLVLEKTKEVWIIVHSRKWILLEIEGNILAII